MKKIKLQIGKNGKEVRSHTIEYDETEGTQFLITINNCKYEIDVYGNIVRILE